MSVVTLALAYAGFVMLCLTIPRHARKMLEDDPQPNARNWLRAGGWCAVSATWFAAVLQSGWQSGTLIWIVTLMAAALILVLMLTYAKQFALILAEAVPLAMGVGIFIGI